MTTSASHPPASGRTRRFGRAAGVGAALWTLLAPLPVRAGEALDGLRFVEWQSREPVTLEGAIDGALSPDGRTLYVAALLDDAIVAYRRDPQTGAISVRQSIGAPFLDGPVDLVVTPDGGDVYGAAILSDAVVHLERDPVVGTLESITLAPAPSGEPPLDGASGVAIAPDGSELFAVGLDDSRLFVYPRAPDGTLSAPVTWNISLIGARDVAISPDGDHLYIADLDGDRLSVIERLGSGAVAITQVLIEGVGGVSGLDGAYSVTVSPDGADVYVTGYNGHTLAHFDRDPATGVLTQAGLWGNGAGGIDGLDGPLSVVVSDDGESLFVTSSAPGAVFVFSRDAATGGLAFADVHSTLGDPHAGLLNAAGVLTHGDSVVVMGLIEHAVSVWQRTSAGGLRRIETQYDDPQIFDLPETVVAVPGEPRVLAFGLDVCGGGTCLRYSSFLRDGETGALTAIASGDFAPLDLFTPQAAAISPDGRYVYLASAASHGILAAERSPDGADLTPVALYVDGVGGIDGLAGVQNVLVSPDGAFVYAAARHDHVVSRFALDGQTGELTWLGSAPAFATRRIAQSRDGRHLYATSGNSSLLAFARDSASGALTQIDVETEGVGGVTGLLIPTGVAVSRDGGTVYVTDNTNPPLLAAFTRDPATGTLTWLETYDQGTMDLPIAVAVEAGGGHVYVAGAADPGTVAVYRRDRATGSLLYLRTLGTSASDPLRLDDVASFSLSPDGRHLYAAASSDRTVAVFATDDIFLDGFEFGSLDAWSSFAPLPP